MTEIEDQLDELEFLLYQIAGERIGSQPWLFEDALQEARIAVWQRLEQGHSMGIAVHAAKQAVIDIVRGRRTTGSEMARVPIGAHDKAVSLIQEAPEGGSEWIIEPVDTDSIARLAEIEARDMLSRALAALEPSQRYIVWLHFYEGLTMAEIGKEFGVTSQAISLRLKKIYTTLAPILGGWS